MHLSFDEPITHRRKKRDRSAAPPSFIYEPREEMPRLVATLRFIGRRGRRRGRFADGQLMLLATEENSRQLLVTCRVGAGGIATPSLGLVERKKLRRDFRN